MSTFKSLAPAADWKEAPCTMKCNGKKLALIREGGRYPSQDEARDDHASRTVTETNLQSTDVWAQHAAGPVVDLIHAWSSPLAVDSSIYMKAVYMKAVYMKAVYMKAVYMLLYQHMCRQAEHLP